MSQSDFGTINPLTKSGSGLATDLNNWRTAVNSGHKGGTEPTYKIAGLRWIDDSDDPIWIYKFYDGTTWIPLLEIDTTANVAVPAGITSRLKFPAAGGSANALTLTPAVAMIAYADQDVVTFEAASNNSGAATLNISGVGAKAIRKIIGGADVALVAGDLLDGRRYVVNYDSAANSAAGAWILVEPSLRDVASGGTGASTASAAFDNLKQAATASATGVVELATAAEVATGTDAARVPSVATMASHQGMAKAWVAFNGTGTPAILASYNVSSITDNGTGDYTINFASAMADANYSVSLSSRILVGAGGGGMCRILAATAPTASALRIDTLNYSGTVADPVLVTAAIFR